MKSDALKKMVPATSPVPEQTSELTTESEPGKGEATSKKEQIISLYTLGIDNLDDIALMTASRTTYVASVLQAAGLIKGYFDLYTTTGHPMNTYSRFFAGKLGFKDRPTADRSVGLIDQLYRRFEIARDRAGQHHSLMMALTMFNRARWTGKQEEANVFRQWLLNKLSEPEAKAITQSIPEEPEELAGKSLLEE